LFREAIAIFTRNTLCLLQLIHYVLQLIVYCLLINRFFVTPNSWPPDYSFSLFFFLGHSCKMSVLASGPVLLTWGLHALACVADTNPVAPANQPQQHKSFTEALNASTVNN
jgi:hypothetical protein